MIEEITLQGFKSYRHRQKIRFTNGVNKISGRNASGKTTILEAVIYGLFGEVPRVDKKDLVSINGGTMVVSVVFRSPYTDKRVRIRREGALVKRKRQGVPEEGFKSIKNMLEVDGEPVLTKDPDIQKRLRELIGIGKNTFLNVIYAQQKEFVEILNPAKNRMDAILGLTSPTEIREQLRETRRMLESRGKISEKGAFEERIRGAVEFITDAEGQIGQIESRIAEIGVGLKEKKSKLNDERIRVDDVEVLTGEFRKLERLRNDFSVLQGRMEDREQELEYILDSFGGNPLSILSDITSQRDKTLSTEERLSVMLDGALSVERRGLDGVIARLHHQISEHKELHDQGLTVCPKCGQSLDHQLLEQDIAKWREDLDYRQSRLRDLELEMGQVRDQVVRARNKRISLEKELAGFNEQERRIEELKRNIARLRSQASQFSIRINQGSEQLLQSAEEEMGLSFADLDDAQGRIRDKLNTMREALGELEGEVRSSDLLLKDSKRQLDDFNSRVVNYRKIVEESRSSLESICEYEAKLRVLDNIQEQYRSYEVLLRENTLRNLEWLTYKYFERLTDQQLYSGCHIDRDRYTLKVQPQSSGRLLPAWRAGGGHESLFALAERLALLRVKNFPHMLILDEPTDAVDSENVPQLLEYISKSSQEIGQVLLVTHHGQGEEEGVNLIRVRKVAGESRGYQEFSE